MKIEYDPQRDLLYVYFIERIKKVAETITIRPGVHVDFDRSGKLIGLEILEASKLIGEGVEFKFPEVVPLKV